LITIVSSKPEDTDGTVTITLKVNENMWGYYLLSIDFGVCYSMVFPLLTDFPTGLTITEDKPSKFYFPAGILSS